MEIYFRGTSDAHGVPRLYCECNVCNEARITGSMNRRLRPSIQAFLADHVPLWIDCGPDWYVQMEHANERIVQHMLITHAHFDHIGGLPQWYDQCRSVESPAYLYAAQEVLNEINERFPWISREVNFVAIDDGIAFGDWNLSIWRVNHGHNGYSYAFRFEHRPDGLTWVYCPDSISLTEEQQQPLENLDLLIIGTSFYKEPFPIETRSLYDVTEVLECIKLWKPKQVRLTHLSHDINIAMTDKLPPHVQYAHIDKPIKLL